MATIPPITTSQNNNPTINLDRSTTYVKILEEPAAKALRFRYECEGRSAGSLPGANSTHDKKTFPKIQVISSTILNRGVVVVSCVTVDPPYRPHPHNLVGKEGCKKGVCTMEISCNENGIMICEFSNLGIQCVKKKDIEESLKIREEIRVDPFRTGFGHKNQPGSIDLNAVRLCFQVFLEGPERGQFKIPLKPVVSEPIYDKKAINDLTIMKLSDCTSPVLGNKEIILLCDKVSKDDIEIRFFEENDQGQLIWEAFGDFQPSDVHKQYAICFRTPPFRDLETPNPFRVFIQLRCPSKDTTSVARPFDYLPLSSDSEVGLLKRKRLMINSQNQRIGNHIDETINNDIIKRPRVPPQLLIQNNAYGNAQQPQPSPSNNSNNNNYIKQEPGTSSQQNYYNMNYYGNQFNNFQQPAVPQQQHDNLKESNSQIVAMDFGNISLPNLSDVNLSLLESHLSENFNDNLNISDNNF